MKAENAPQPAASQNPEVRESPTVIWDNISVYIDGLKITEIRPIILVDITYRP